MSSVTIPRENIAGIECRFAHYLKAQPGQSKDYHMVKEVIHTKDGKQIPNIRMVPNFERAFWITKPAFRNHKQKKEWELKSRLTEFKCTQSQLDRRIVQALDALSYNGNRRQLFRSPYIYGADVTSTALLKHKYQQHQAQIGLNPTPYSTAAFDIETSMVDGTIIMATLSFRERMVTVIRKDVVAGILNPEEKLRALLTQHLGEYERERQIQWEILFVNAPSDIIAHCFKRAHEWMPDFVSIWNIDFEMTKIQEMADRERVNLADIFSDPGIQYQDRFFEYRQGPKQKRTASGKVTPIKPSAQWHVVNCPASFRIFDGMQVYRQVRTGAPEEQSYSLNATLNRELKLTKLYIGDAGHLLEGSAEWHTYMQEHCILEYTIYNTFDCIALELLEEKTKDFAFSMPTYCGAADFNHFNSQPRRKVVELHFECLEQGLVIGTTSDQMADEIDDQIYNLSGWIVNLPAHLIADRGLQVIQEDPNLRTNAYAHVADLDVSSSYPNNGAALHISRQTTRTEMIGVTGVDLETTRMQGMNFLSGHTNAVEFTTKMLGLPDMEAMLSAFIEDKINASRV